MTRALPFLFCLGAIALLTVMNGVIKGQLVRYDTLQISFLRYLSGGLWAVALIYWMRPGWPNPATVKAQVLRGVLGTISGTSFFYALSQLSLADAFTIGFLAPLFVPLFGLVFLKEYPRGVDVLAVFLGFVGMLVIVSGASGAGGVRSWFGIGAGALSAITYALSLTMLRSLAQKDPFLLIVLFQHWVSALLLAPAAYAVWTMPSATDLMLIAIAAGLGVGGHLLIARAYSLAPAARMAPLEYSSLIYAAFIDYMWFGLTLKSETLIGAVAIVIGALLATRR